MSLGNAIGYLTALRVPPRRQVPLTHSLQYFPWIGGAIGSLSILAFLAANRVLPNILCCLFAVLFQQFLAGWGPWRGAAESVQGLHTHPGYGFLPGFRLDARGAGLLAGLLVFKWIALAVMPLEWQTRAVFVVPILGSCARTAAFLLSPARNAARSLLLARNRVRGGFLSAVLMLLVFLFPIRAAIPALLLAACAAYFMLRRRNARTRGLTLQTASWLSEQTEVALLLWLSVASRWLAPLVN